MAHPPNAFDSEGSVPPISRVPTQDELTSMPSAVRGPAIVRPAAAQLSGHPQPASASPHEPGPPQPKNRMAVASLVVGIASMVVGLLVLAASSSTSFLFTSGVAAAVLGIYGLRHAGGMPHAVGETMAIAGLSLGAMSAVTGTTVVVGTVMASGVAPAAEAQIVVHRVIDGDTVDVVQEGDTVRIRLLNIDTPETRDPNEPVGCLGPEATKFLQTMLPAGTPVTLEYDVERTDRYGRDLAGVFLDDRTFVNAEIARAGLGEAVVFEPNEKFYPRVSAAEDEARDSGRGLFGRDVACTKAAAEAKAYQKSVSTLVGKAPGSSADLTKIDAYADQLVKKIREGEELKRVLDRDEAANRVGRGHDTTPGEVIARQLDRLNTAEKDNAQTRKRAAQRIERAREAERAAEEARRAAEAEAAAREAASRETETDATGGGSSGSGTSGGGGSGGSGGSDDSSGTNGGATYDPSYTGCRAYGDSGRWLDDQGRRYDKIDCTTKAIIG